VFSVQPGFWLGGSLIKKKLNDSIHFDRINKIDRIERKKSKKILLIL